VTLPEWLFDLDGPGHYMRRIKHARLSLPSITGPYTSVNCTLSLLKSSVRKSPLLKDGEYAREGSEDDRFADSFGALQSMVTSSGNNDAGMFETNLRDERFLPFEGAGVESTWKLELPREFRQFDYSTISDVILHLRYTARQGGTASFAFLACRWTPSDVVSIDPVLGELFLCVVSSLRLCRTRAVAEANCQTSVGHVFCSDVICGGSP
jgi:hypothetical protein